MIIMTQTRREFLQKSALFIVALAGTKVVHAMLTSKPKGNNGSGNDTKKNVEYKPSLEDDLDAYSRRMARVHEKSVLQINQRDIVDQCAMIDRDYENIIKNASDNYGIPISTLEAMILIESGGDPTARSGSAYERSGLCKISLENARKFGLKVDIERSNNLTMQIDEFYVKLKQGKIDNAHFEKVVRQLQEKRREIDERFNPEKSLDMMAKYLRQGIDMFGALDLAVWSYRAGNEDVAKTMYKFMSPDVPTKLSLSNGTISEDASKIGRWTKNQGSSLAQVSYQVAEGRHPNTESFLSSLKEKSHLYYFDVLAAERIFSIFRSNPDELLQMSDAYNEVKITRIPDLEQELGWFRPDQKERMYEDVSQLKKGYEHGLLVPFPNDQKVFGFSIDDDPVSGIGVKDFGNRNLYQGASKEVVGLLMYLGNKLRGKAEVFATSGVRTKAYQEKLESSKHSTHIFGQGVDIGYSSLSPEQKNAINDELVTMQKLGLICYTLKEGDHFHIAVNPEAKGMFEKIYIKGLEHYHSLKDKVAINK